MPTLTQQQLSRQDFVDNSIYELINSLNPTNKEIPWNIEMLGEVWDTISHWLVDDLNLCTEKKFYP